MLPRFLVALILSLTLVSGFITAPQRPTNFQLKAAKLVTPSEALAIVEKGGAYLDVRTETEYKSGHPLPSVNAPIYVEDEQGMLIGNPVFLPTVEALFGKDETLVVGCLAGPRSTAACEMLEGAGYTDLVNVKGGWKAWAWEGLPYASNV
ncbi:unnamed protein product [Chrysoparadoxa australica]